VLQYFLYNEQTGSQVEIGGGDSEEAGPSKRVCGQEVTGKFTTNLKIHLKKHHVVQYQEVAQTEEDRAKKRKELQKKQRRSVAKGTAYTPANTSRKNSTQQGQ